MSLQVGGPGHEAAVQKAEQTDLRKFLPADLAKAKGKELEVKHLLIGDRQIKSINYSKANALESCTIVTDKETISFTEMIENDKYFIRLNFDGDKFDLAVSGGVGDAELKLTNPKSGALTGATIQPGFAKASFQTSMGAIKTVYDN
jgi:hypothetical protein